MCKILTIAVPMYNVQKYVRQCLGSFLVQGIGQEIEVLAIDDGSYDHTSEIAQTYARDYPWLFRYIRKENGGHGSAVNTALRYAQGKYFMVVDGDDWVAREDFRALITELTQFDVDLAVSHYARVENGQAVMVHSEAPAYRKIIRFNQLGVSGYYFVLSSICYRTELLKQAGFRLPEKVYYDDLLYITQPMQFVEKIVFLDIAPYQYRVGLKSQSTAKKHMAGNYLQHRKIVCRMLADYDDCRSLRKQTVQLRYIRTVVIRALKDHYGILLQYEQDVRLAVYRLRQMDAFLYSNFRSFYQELPQHVRLLNLLRKSDYQLLAAYRVCTATRRLCMAVKSCKWRSKNIERNT